jgi:hypothetical protein
VAKVLAIAPIFLLGASSYGLATPIPKGFNSILDRSGVQAYRRDLGDGRSEYVTVVNLKRGKITHIIGTVSQTPHGKIERKSLLGLWDLAAKNKPKNTTLQILVNGTFFSQKLDPAPLAFGLKVGRKVVSYGYGLDEFPGLLRIFGFNDRKAAIANLNDAKIFDNSFPNLVGALDSTANKSADKYLPRTFVGIKDTDGDRNYETVIFYSSSAVRQIDASHTLDSFGVQKKVMLDGGSSTGLTIDGVVYIQPNRTIPHAIAIYASQPK